MRHLLLLAALCVGVMPQVSDAIELVVPTQHAEAVTALVFVQNDSLLVSASRDGTIRIWDPASGRMLRTIAAHVGEIKSLAPSPDGQLLASGGDDKVVRVWSVASGELIREVALEGAASQVSWSRNGKECAAVGGNSLMVFEPTTLASPQRLRNISSALGVAFLPGEHRLAVSTGYGHTLRVIHSQTDQLLGETRVAGTPTQLRAVGDRVVALAGYSLLIFKADDLSLIATLDAQEAINAMHVEFSKNMLVAVGASTNLHVWNTNGKSRDGVKLDSGVHTAVAVSSRGAYLALGEFDGTIKLMEFPSGKKIREMGGKSSVVYRVDFQKEGSLVVTGATGSSARVWSVGPDEENLALDKAILNLRGTEWIVPGRTLITSSPLQIVVWDVQRQRALREVATKTINGWPVRCHESGICAWEENEATSSIAVENLLTGKGRQAFPCGEDTILALDISPDGKYLAAAVNRPVIRIWSLQSGLELPALPLQTHPEDSMQFKTLWMNAQKLFVPRMGIPTAVRFSPDSKRLATGNEHGVHVWNVPRFQPGGTLSGYQGRVTSLTFSDDGEWLYAAAEDATLREWEIAGTKSSRVVARTSGLPLGLSIQADRKFASINLPGGQTEIWDLTTAKKLFTLAFLSDGGWLAFTPDGLFEATEGTWRDALFRLTKNNFPAEPVERYFRDFYRSGLVAAVLNGDAPTAPREIESLDRRVPSVKLTPLGSIPGTMTTLPDGSTLEVPERMKFRIDVKAAAPASGVGELHLLHNGVLLRKWPAPSRQTASAMTQEVEVEMLPGDNDVSAFAFNVAGMQSAPAVWARPHKGWGYFPLPRTLHVVAVGVAKYRDSRFNLEFPDDDANLVAQALGLPETEWQKQGQRLMDWSNTAVLETLRSRKPEEVPSSTHIIKLINEDATHERILEAIRQVVSEAKPQDAVLLYFSGHGMATADRFFFLPHDQGLTVDLDDARRADLERAAPTLLSDADLEQALQGLYVTHAAIVFDACNSGQALEGADLRGPLAATGLARLAYEKGVALLAASERASPSAELRELRQSVLTYALVREGLIEAKSDQYPRDGRIELNEWLSYATGRVPRLMAEQFDKKSGKKPKEPSRVRYAPRRIPEPSALVLKALNRQP